VCMPFTSTRPADALGRYLDDLSLWFVRETLTDGRGQGSNWFSTTFFSTASRATPLGGVQRGGRFCRPIQNRAQTFPRARQKYSLHSRVLEIDLVAGLWL
jgi:hypothetical protein